MATRTPTILYVQPGAIWDGFTVFLTLTSPVCTVGAGPNVRTGGGITYERGEPGRRSAGIVTAVERTPRDQRLNVRASANQALLIRRAAAVLDKSMTEFLLESATSRAEQVLADRRWFMLDDDSWERFQALLDGPVEDMPRLRALLAEPSVFLGD